MTGEELVNTVQQRIDAAFRTQLQGAPNAQVGWQNFATVVHATLRELFPGVAFMDGRTLKALSPTVRHPVEGVLVDDAIYALRELPVQIEACCESENCRRIVLGWEFIDLQTGEPYGQRDQAEAAGSDPPGG